MQAKRAVSQRRTKATSGSLAGGRVRQTGRQEAVKVSIGELSAKALRGVIESFVNREGTDYGAVERTLDDKVADVMRQLEEGSARVVFDPETESIQITTVE